MCMVLLPGMPSSSVWWLPRIQRGEVKRSTRRERERSAMTTLTLQSLYFHRLMAGFIPVGCPYGVIGGVKGRLRGCGQRGGEVEFIGCQEVSVGRVSDSTGEVM